MAVCSPLGKADDMVEVPAQRVDIFLLLFQTQLMVLSQSLGVNVHELPVIPNVITALQKSFSCADETYLKLVNQNLSLPVDLHYQVTDRLLYFICYRLPVFVNLLESVRNEGRK